MILRECGFSRVGPAEAGKECFNSETTFISYSTIKDPQWYVVEGSDPPRRTSYNDDAQRFFFVWIKMKN